MAFSAIFSPYYTPQTSLLSPTTSSFPPQPTNKFLVQPLRYTRISPMGVNPKRSVGKVKASMKWEKSYKNVEVFAKDHLAVSLAYDVAELSCRYTKERGTFTVVLSGGPVTKYLGKLVEPPYKDSIEWSKWHVFWVEERVVAKDHLESNHKLAQDGFLSKVPIPPENVHAIDETNQVDKATETYEENLRDLVKRNVIIPSANGFPKFDLMLLSMGAEGEVGSLFPRHPVLKEDKKWVSFMTDAPKAPAERITFTFPVINSSSNIAMLATGAGKANAIYSALEDDQKTEKLPVELVSPEGELKWYLDKGAASKLFKE